MSNAPEPHRKSEVGRGIAYGAAAYSLWGLAPLYWQLLKPASSLEIVANRTIWSFVFVAPLVLLRGSWPTVKADLRDSRKRNLLLIASILISANWILFIWATTHGHVLDSALGYFGTPLFSTALGVIFFKERLRKLQWGAIGIAVLAVAYITWEHHAFPWIGLSLASSFAVYGAVKKMAGVDAIESLLIETAYLAPIALVYLAIIAANGTMSFGKYGWDHALFLAGAGPATAIPLLFYGAAVVRAPLFYIGFLQYISSSIQFFVGIFVFHEDMDMKRFLGFAITWSALVLLGTDSIRQRRTPAYEVVEYD
jgi:chloramphenicol-sensitive protein RarD